MEHELLRLQTQFSELRALQHAHCVCYRLTEKEGNYFIRVADTAFEQELCLAVCGSQQRLSELVRYLYENAVPLLHCADVLNDLGQEGSFSLCR